jgi:uncharacterized Zn finger protein
VGSVIIQVTCELCGQSWQRKEATSEQFVECIFCGSVGRLALGPVPPERDRARHVMAWLRCDRWPSG